MTLAWFEVVGGLLAAFGLGGLTGAFLLLAWSEKVAARRELEAAQAAFGRGWDAGWDADREAGRDDVGRVVAFRRRS